MTPEELAARARHAGQFLQRLRRLSRLHEQGKPHEELRRIADTLFRNDAFREFQKTYLQLYVAGFLYLDPAQQRTDYQFFREAESKDSGPSDSGYTLAYIWPEGSVLPPFDTPEQATAFIDCLFLVMRDNQSPWQSGKLGCPEYVACVPQIGADNGEGSVQRDNELRSLYGWHYCPYGELVFFLYLWRLFLWTSLAEDNPKKGVCLWEMDDFSPAVTSASSNHALWDDQWGRPTYSGTYERILRDWAYDRKSSKFGDPAIVQKGLQYFDAPMLGGSPWERDRYHLLLVKPNGEAGVGLRPLLRFAGALSVNCGLNLAEVLASEQSIQDADRHLRRIAAGWVSACTGGKGFDTWRDAFNGLHRRSRFPIIPYFYWNAIDHSPKTHGVIPVWKSWTAPVTVPVFTEQVSSNPRRLVQETVLTSIVGLSVIGIRPMADDISSTHADPDQVALGDADRQRVAWIGEILQRGCLPQVDAHYYFDLQRARDRQVTGSLLRSFGHDGSKPAGVALKLLKCKDIPAGLRMSAVRVLLKALETRLSGYSNLALDPYSMQQWREEAKEQDRCPLSQLINSSVLLALMNVALTTEFAELRRCILDTTTAGSFELLERQWKEWLTEGKPPDGNITLDASDGTTRLRVQHEGAQNIWIPRRVEAPEARTGTARIYSGLGFIFDELLLNTFRHQYNQIPKAVRDHGISISSSIQLQPENETYSIRLEFAPLTVNLPPLKTDFSSERNKTFVGLESLDLMFKRLGFEPGQRASFKPSSGSPLDLPACTDNRGLPKPVRIWAITKIPMATTSKEKM